mgnify:CR=1 FL=1
MCKKLCKLFDIFFANLLHSTLTGLKLKRGSKYRNRHVRKVQPSIEEIKCYLEDHREEYLEALRRIKGIFEKYYYSPAGRRVLYRIATRADSLSPYQRGEELKTPQSILRKMRDLQKGGKEIRLTELRDVIGVRLVCIFPSDKATVVEYIKELADKKELTVLRKELVKKPRHKAEHLTVALTDPRLSHIKCEIQVLSMLDHVFSSIEHDMVYTRREDVGKHYINHMDSLSRYLSTTNNELNRLKKQVDYELQFEEKKKNAARQALITALVEEELPKLGKGRENTLSNLFRNLETMSLEKISEKVLSYENRYKVDRALCLFVILAALDKIELKNMALHYADKLIESSPEKEKGHAHRIKWYALYTFDMLEYAIGEAKRALVYGEKYKDDELVYRAKNAIAYFIADSGDDSSRNIGKGYIDDLIQHRPNDQTVLDTKAYLLIRLGKTLKDVEAGYKLAKKIEKDAKRANSLVSRASRAYFELNKYFYLKRLNRLKRPHST